MPKVMPEDLVNTVIAADDLRRKARGLPSTQAAKLLGQKRPPARRVFTEPFFNAVGLLCGQMMRLLPAPLWRPFVQWLNAKMGGFSAEINPDLRARADQTVRLAKDIKQRTGQWPALLILTSHPETEGPLQWLRFELLRQGLQVADALVEARRPAAWYPPHPRCLLAIDPFALDTVSAPIGALYGAWMHRVYLAWDRQPSTQSWIQKQVLLRGSDYSRVGWRLLAYLKADVPMLMVLSGGLPYNARLLYAAREFVQRLSVRLWKIPKCRAEKELLVILMRSDGGVWPADGGQILPEKRRAMAAALASWGVPGDRIGPALEELEDEFRLAVPYRARLFRVLLARLVKKGKPLLLVGIGHAETAPHVRLCAPIEVSRDADPEKLARSFARFLNFAILLIACMAGECAAAAWAGPLPGAWKGKIHRQAIYETQYHQAIYIEDLDLTLRMGVRGVSGQGSVHLSDPVITRTRPDPRYAQWTAAYITHDFVVAVQGSVSGQDGKDMIRITLTPASPPAMRFRYRDGTGAATQTRLDLPMLLPQSIPIRGATIGRFSLRRTTGRGDVVVLPPDLAYFGEPVVSAEYRSDGHFEKVETPARIMSSAAMLAALLAYLALVLPRLIRKPDSCGFVSMLGTLLGSLRKLQYLGLVWTTANQARWASYAAAAMIGALELSRRHKKNPGARGGRAIVAALLDLSAFAACAAMTPPAIDYALLYAARIGDFGEVMAAIAAAVVVTHVVAASFHAAKVRML